MASKTTTRKAHTIKKVARGARLSSAPSSKKKITKPAKKVGLAKSLNKTRKSFLARRPHRSFKLTRRRNYARQLKLPGYFAFTAGVLQHLKKYAKVFISLIFVAATVTFLLVGLASQDSFKVVSSLLHDASSDVFQGGWGEIGKASILLASGVTGGFSGQLSDVEQIFSAIIGLLVWLVTVWLLRAQVAGKSPRLRDALYNAGAPIVSTGLLFLLFVAQVLPGVLGIVIYTTVASAAVLSGFMLMLAFIAIFLLVLLSTYLATSTVVALVVVTLPGMYPWQALKIAGDLVVGRRIRILLRLVWLVVSLAVLWTIILVPIVLFASWLQATYDQTAWVPIVPVALLLASTASIVFAGSYVYLLYRKVVDDDSPPA